RPPALAGGPARGRGTFRPDMSTTNRPVPAREHQRRPHHICAAAFGVSRSYSPTALRRLRSIASRKAATRVVPQQLLFDVARTTVPAEENIDRFRELGLLMRIVGSEHEYVRPNRFDDVFRHRFALVQFDRLEVAPAGHLLGDLAYAGRQREP